MSALSPNLAHYGVCLNTLTDSNGFVKSVALSPPVIGNSGNDTCPQGVFVSVVPAP